MTSTVVPFDESLLEDVVRVFNRENERFDYVVPLTAALFRERIMGKTAFSGERCFVLLDGDAVGGFALTCPGPNKAGTEADSAVAVIDGLFFSERRLSFGEKLLDHCLDFYRRRGAATIYGWASFGGYPFWRDLYCGAEPVCLTDYRQAWVTFMVRGFEHHQQSLNYVGLPRVIPYRKDLDYSTEDLALDSPWARDSWLGLHPKTLVASAEGRRVGRLGYVHLPALSEHRGKRTCGIYGMNVVPERRRRGIAASMLGKLFELEGNAGEILVGTQAANTPARRSYEAAGMRVAAFRTGTRLTLGPR